MTWKEFKNTVDGQLTNGGLNDNIPLAYIDYSPSVQNGIYDVVDIHINSNEELEI
jgi:hypothetical protein